MESPLLAKSKRVNGSFSKATFVIIFSLALSCLSIVFFHFYIAPNEASELSETSVGMNLSRLRMITTYFVMGNLADLMKYGINYTGPNHQVLTPFDKYCTDTTPFCDDICSQRATASLSAPLIEEPRVCRNRANGEPFECWIVKDMRCWGLDKSVWGGAQEWTVVSESLNTQEGTAGLPWIHFVSRPVKTHFFLFGKGAGSNPKYQHIMQLIMDSSELMREVTSAGEDEQFLFAGHSEGAAWAACMNLIIAQSGVKPIDRFTIGTGTPLANSEFHTLYNRAASPLETSLFLLLGVATSTGPEAEVYSDVAQIFVNPEVGCMTMDQFGYICIEVEPSRYQCLDPQPLRRMAMAKTVQQLRRGNPAVKALHDFRTYRSCFLACSDYFASREGDFAPNMKSFVSQPQTTFTRPLPPGRQPRGGGLYGSGSPPRHLMYPGGQSSSQAGPSSQTNPMTAQFNPRSPRPMSSSQSPPRQGQPMNPMAQQQPPRGHPPLPFGVYAGGRQQAMMQQGAGIHPHPMQGHPRVVHSPPPQHPQQVPQPFPQQAQRVPPQFSQPQQISPFPQHPQQIHPPFPQQPQQVPHSMAQQPQQVPQPMPQPSQQIPHPLQQQQQSPQVPNPVIQALQQQQHQQRTTVGSPPHQPLIQVPRPDQTQQMRPLPPEPLRLPPTETQQVPQTQMQQPQPVPNPPQTQSVQPGSSSPQTSPLTRPHSFGTQLSNPSSPSLMGGALSSHSSPDRSERFGPQLLRGVAPHSSSPLRTSSPQRPSSDELPSSRDRFGPQLLTGVFASPTSPLRPSSDPNPPQTAGRPPFSPQVQQGAAGPSQPPPDQATKLVAKTIAALNLDDDEEPK